MKRNLMDIRCLSPVIFLDRAGLQIYLKAILLSCMMRKREARSPIEQLEQRRLLSGGIAPASGSVQIGSIPFFNYYTPTPANDDVGISGVAVSGVPMAGMPLLVNPVIVQTGAMAYLDYQISVALSTDNVWGNSDDIAIPPSGSVTGNFHGGDVSIPQDTPAGDYQLLVHITPVLRPADTNPIPTDINPSDDVLDAGTVSVAAYNNSDNGTPLLADDGVFGANFPGSAAAGTFINVVPQVISTGDLANVDYSVSAVLSADGVWGDGVALPTAAVLAGGDPSLSTFHSGLLEIPDGLAPGNYQVMLKVLPHPDMYQTAATDTNPSDDMIVAGSITVTNYVPADLAVTGATFPSSAPAGVGSSMNLAPTITAVGGLTGVQANVGVALSRSGVWGNTDNIFLSGPIVGEDLPGQVDLGGIQPGTYQLLIHVEIDYAYLENAYLPQDTNAADDTLDAGPLTITPNDSADMGVTGANFPNSVAAGSTFDLEPAVVRYGGLANADYEIYAQLSTDSDWGNSANVWIPVPNLFQAGDVTIPQTVAPGTYQLLLELQSLTGISSPVDTNPGDDIVSAGPITITPDETNNMAVISATFSSTIFPGGPIDLVPTIFRSGTLANTDYNIGVALSNDRIWGNSDDILLTSAAGTSDTAFEGWNLVIPEDVQEGYYNLLIHVSPRTVDADNPPPADQVPADDTLWETVYVGPVQNDFAVLSASFSASAQAGSDALVSPTVGRYGDLANADYNISVALSTSSTWGDSDNISLTPDGSFTTDFHGGDVEVPSTVPAGTYQLLINVGPPTNELYGYGTGDALAGDDTLDAGTITINAYNPPTGTTPPPTGSSPAETGDLGVTSATFPAIAAANSVIDIEPTIIRTGAFTSHDYEVWAALSMDDVFGNSDDIALVDDNGVNSSGLNGNGDLNYDNTQSPFHSGDMGISSNVPAGIYHLFLSIGVPITDISSEIGQTPPVDVNTADNVLDAGTITITPYIAPDLGISSATFPATAAAGSKIDIEPTVTRVGGFENYDYTVTAVLSTDGILGNSDDISLQQPDDFTLTAFHSGDLIIPSNAKPGIYHLLLSIAEFSGLNFPSGTLPTDSDSADDTLDAGTIIVTANSSIINPGGPIQNPMPTPIAEAPAGEAFHVPSLSSGKYSSLYLSSNTTLEVPRGSSRKLLKEGAIVTIGTPDAKLKMGANQFAAIPQNTAPGLYYLLATTKNGSQVLDVGTVTVDAGAPQMQAVVHPKNKSVTAGTVGLVNLTFRNTGSVAASDLPVSLYLSTDQNYADGDTQLIAGALSTINIAPRGLFSNSYVTEFPATVAANKYYILACTDMNGTINVVGVSPKTISVS
jgi:hypothetical protein